MVLECVYFQGVKRHPRQAAEGRPDSGRSRAQHPTEGVNTFFHNLFESVGLPPEAYRGTALNRRVPACLRFLRVKDLKEAQAKLEGRPDLAAATVSIVLLGVTEFCRDRAVFDQLRTTVMPDLARKRRPLRVWSAACSDGRELASVAILLAESGLLARAKLLGTDCRADAIRQASDGEFPLEALNKVEPSWKKHFTLSRQGVRPAAALRQCLRWKQANLLKTVEPGPWDLILWRNMAIYLERNAAERIWLALVRELAPGGYLCTGKADHPPPYAALEKLGPCLYRKQPLHGP